MCWHLLARAKRSSPAFEALRLQDAANHALKTECGRNCSVLEALETFLLSPSFLMQWRRVVGWRVVCADWLKFAIGHWDAHSYPFAGIKAGDPRMHLWACITKKYSKAFEGIKRWYSISFVDVSLDLSRRPMCRMRSVTRQLAAAVFFANANSSEAVSCCIDAFVLL